MEGGGGGGENRNSILGALKSLKALEVVCCLVSALSVPTATRRPFRARAKPPRPAGGRGPPLSARELAEQRHQDQEGLQAHEEKETQTAALAHRQVFLQRASRRTGRHRGRRRRPRRAHPHLRRPGEVLKRFTHGRSQLGRGGRGGLQGTRRRQQRL